MIAITAKELNAMRYRLRICREQIDRCCSDDPPWHEIEESLGDLEELLSHLIRVEG
jgi:hypothetical protein